MKQIEKDAILAALIEMDEASGGVWYSYRNTEYGEPVYIDELIKKVEKMGVDS